MGAEGLKFYRASKDGASDGFTLQAVTVDTGSDASNIIDAAITDADGTWDDAHIRFDDATTTSALQGVIARVKSWTLSTNTLELQTALPATPVNTDTAVLWLGGNYRSATEIDGMQSTAPSNVTGVTIDAVADMNGTGNGTLTYTNATTVLQWTAPSGTIGAAVDVSIDGTYTLYDSDTNKWITVTVVAASLPGSDQSDSLTLSRTAEDVIYDIKGAESDAGATRYFPILAKNETGATLTDLRAYFTEDAESQLEIGKGTVTANQFENPADINTAPSAVTFSAAAIDYTNGIQFGNLAASSFVVLWVKEITSAGATAHQDVLDLITFNWE